MRKKITKHGRLMRGFLFSLENWSLIAAAALIIAIGAASFFRDDIVVPPTLIQSVLLAMILALLAAELRQQFLAAERHRQILDRLAALERQALRHDRRQRRAAVSAGDHVNAVGLLDPPRPRPRRFWPF